MIFVEVEEYFATCPWMNDLDGWKKWILFFMFPTNIFLQKIEQKTLVENPLFLTKSFHDALPSLRLNPLEGSTM
jgi:hypothetical protein